MNKSSRPSTLTLVICSLSLVLVFLVGVLIFLSAKNRRPVLEAPTTEATTQATETQPPETTEAPTEATEPQPTVYTLTFAGDCTMGNKKGAGDKTGFIGKVGDDYAYPFYDVQQYFANDDCTFINLENPLLDSGGKAAHKTFVFKGPTRYTNILTQGSVEFANVVNNHTQDYGQEGYESTKKALDGAGVFYAEMEKTVLFTTESGLKIGVYADMNPNGTKGIADQLQKLREDGAEVVVACFHWGQEYSFKRTANQQKIARFCIDNGADIVYGHHSHVLQEVEAYNGGYIFYSLGNFSFGGNPNPPDKDTAIIQTQFIRDIDGTVRMGETTLIPCFVSGSKGNDYQPCPMDPVEDAKAYERAMKKLSGTYHLKRLVVSYREDLFPTKPTDPEQDATGSTEAVTPSDPVTPPTQGGNPPAESTPTEEQKPPAESKPTEEQKPPAESKPTEEQKPPAESKPAEEQKPPAQPEPPASGSSESGEGGGE